MKGRSNDPTVTNTFSTYLDTSDELSLSGIELLSGSGLSKVIARWAESDPPAGVYLLLTQLPLIGILSILAQVELLIEAGISVQLAGISTQVHAPAKSGKGSKGLFSGETRYLKKISTDTEKSGKRWINR